MDGNALLRPPEVARRLSVSRARAYQLIASGEIASIRVGRLVRVTVDDLEAFIARARRQAIDA